MLGEVVLTGQVRVKGAVLLPNSEPLENLWTLDLCDSVPGVLSFDHLRTEQFQIRSDEDLDQPVLWIGGRNKKTILR